MSEGITIVTSNPPVERDLDQVRKRRAELAKAKGDTRAALADLIGTLGRRVAEGSDDPGELGGKIADLRARDEGLTAGIDYLDMREAQLLRRLPWARQ